MTGVHGCGDGCRIDRHPLGKLKNVSLEPAMSVSRVEVVCRHILKGTIDSPALVGHPVGRNHRPRAVAAPGTVQVDLLVACAFDCADECRDEPSITTSGAVAFGERKRNPGRSPLVAHSKTGRSGRSMGTPDRSRDSLPSSTNSLARASDGRIGDPSDSLHTAQVRLTSICIPCNITSM